MATYMVNCRHLWNQTVAEALSCLGQKSNVAGYIQSMETRLLRYGCLHPPSHLVNPNRHTSDTVRRTRRSKGRSSRRTGDRRSSRKKNGVDFYDHDDPFIDDRGQWMVSNKEQEMIDEMDKKRIGVRRKMHITRRDTDYIIAAPNLQMQTKKFSTELALYRRMECSHSNQLQHLVQQVQTLDAAAFRRLVGEVLRKGRWKRHPKSKVMHASNFTAGGLLICQGIEQELKDWYVAQSGRSGEGWDEEAAKEREMLLSRLPKPLTQEQMWASVAENMFISPALKQKLKNQGWAPPNFVSECPCTYSVDTCLDARETLDVWLLELERQSRQSLSSAVFEESQLSDVEVCVSDDDVPPIANAPDGFQVENQLDTPLPLKNDLSSRGHVPAAVSSTALALTDKHEPRGALVAFDVTRVIAEAKGSMLPKSPPTAVVLADPIQKDSVNSVATPCMLTRPPSFVNKSFLLDRVIRIFAKSLTTLLLKENFSTLVRQICQKQKRSVQHSTESSDDELILVAEKNTPAQRYASYMAHAMQTAMQVARMPMQNATYLTPPPSYPCHTKTSKKRKKEKSCRECSVSGDTRAKKKKVKHEVAPIPVTVGAEPFEVAD